MSFNGFGERLKAAIKDSKYSQKEISEKLRINQDTITNYVKEKSYPKADSLYDICDLLGVHADWLLFAKESKGEEKAEHSDSIEFSETETNLVMSYRELSDRDKKEVIAYIKMKRDLEKRSTPPPSSPFRNGEDGTGEEAATSEAV